MAGTYLPENCAALAFVEMLITMSTAVLPGVIGP